MTIKRLLVQRQEDGALLIADAIEHEGDLWLVPSWLKGPIENTEVPEKIISLSGLETQAAPEMYRSQADLFLKSPLSKAILEGQKGQGRDVIDRPDMVRLIRSTVIRETKH